MKKILLVYLAIFTLAGCAFFKVNPLLLDDFEGEIGKETVDFGAGNNSQVDVTANNDIVNTGNQSLEISYDAVPSGYMWIARGYGLDVKGAGEWSARPEKIRWQKYGGFSFYVYSKQTGVMIAFDVKDKDKEIWRKVFTLRQTGWQEITVPFDKLFARTDWQPDKANLNNKLDYPIRSYQFEVRTPGQGVIYIDTVKLFTAD